MEDIITQKKCTKCNAVKDVSCFGKQLAGRGGLRSTCKDCNKEYNQKYSESHPGYVNTWIKNNIQKYKESVSNWRDKNRNKINENSREWAKNNKEKITATNKKYIASHKEMVSKSKADYRNKNKDELNKKRNEWLSINGKVAEYNHKRRAMLVGAGGVVANDEWLQLCEKYNNTCLCCGRNDIALTQDHVIPLKLGGSNTIDNIQPLCRSCNCKKQAKHIDYR